MQDVQWVLQHTVQRRGLLKPDAWQGALPTILKLGFQCQILTVEAYSHANGFLCMHAWRNRGMDEWSGAGTGRCRQYEQFAVLFVRPAEPPLMFS